MMHRDGVVHERENASRTNLLSVLRISLLAFFLVVRRVSASRGGTAHPLERGKELGRVVTAKDLYSAYQEIQREYRSKAFDSKDWKILNQKDGIEIAILPCDSDETCPYVRMTAIMPTPVVDCWNFLSLANWDRTMPKMDPFYEGLTVFKEYYMGRVHMLLARKRTKRVFAFGKRDFVFVSVSDVPQVDGTWVSGTVSVRTPQVPRRKGYTRAYQDSVAFYKPIHNGKQTHLTIVCRIDMNDSAEGGEGGFMPMWIYVKSIGKIGAQSVRNMRRCLEEEVKSHPKPEPTKDRGMFSWLKQQTPTIEEEGDFERETLADEPEESTEWWGKLPWQITKQLEAQEETPKEPQPRGFFRRARPRTSQSSDELEEAHSVPTPPQRIPYSLWGQGRSSS